MSNQEYCVKGKERNGVILLFKSEFTIFARQEVEMAMVDLQ
jgi:hypothetical protein